MTAGCGPVHEALSSLGAVPAVHPSRWKTVPVTDDRHLHGTADVEAEVTSTYDEAAQKGAERLERSWRALLATGFAGGIEVGFGTLAYLSVLHETGNHMLAGLAFSIGFIALYLAHSELFTEGFFYPIMSIFAGRGTWVSLSRLWLVTLVMNLLGGSVMMVLVVAAFPDLHATLADSAHHFIDKPLGWESVCLALLAGAGITLMTRMQAGADSDMATIAAAVVGGFLLAGLQLFHSVLDSIIIIGAMLAGADGVTVGGWLAFFWYVVICNMIGGLALVTLPRMLRSSHLAPAAHERDRA